MPKRGRLLDASGAPLNSETLVVLSLYGDEDAEEPVWSESRTVALTEGYYSVELGSETPLDHTVLDGTERWLAVSIGGEETARQRLNSVPYAITAGLPDVRCPDGSVLTGFDGTGPVCMVLLPGTNLLANASFESTWPVGGDRAAASSWFRSGSLSTNESESEDSSTGLRSLHIAGAGFAYQPIESWADLRGHTVSLSVDVLAGSSGASVSVDDGVSSSTATAGGAGLWERVTVVHAIDPAATHVSVQLQAVDPARFDGATLVLGDLGEADAPALPTRPSSDALHSMRWYETGLWRLDQADNLDNNHSTSGEAINFRVEKAAQPTVDFTNGEYKCFEYDGSGTAATGTASSTGSLFSVSPSCSRLSCSTAIELNNTAQGKRCQLLWNWVATVPEDTH